MKTLIACVVLVAGASVANADSFSIIDGNGNLYYGNTYRGGGDVVYPNGQMMFWQGNIRPSVAIVPQQAYQPAYHPYRYPTHNSYGGQPAMRYVPYRGWVR